MDMPSQTPHLNAIKESVPDAGRISYQRAIRELYSLEKFGSRPGLERIRLLLGLLGNPHKGFRCVLVGGSNGKGSTTEMIGSILSQQGRKTGTYFSPHVVEFPERIRINGRNAGREEIARAYLRVKRACVQGGVQATFFEVATAMALLVFNERKADFAVLEVGLGGRLDATNAVEPEVSALTSLSREHTQVLGNTIGKIAREKCGIAREGRPLLCGLLSQEAAVAVRKECAKKGADAVFVAEEVKVSGLREKGGKWSFKASCRGRNYSVSLSAPGKFQVSNACVALLVCGRLGAGRKEVEDGLRLARPAFRLQEISRRPLLLADCAHNPEAAAALAAELAAIRPKRPVLLFSAMKDKDYGTVLRILAPHFGKAVLTEVSLPRSASLRELFSKANGLGWETALVKSPKMALAAAKRLAGKDGAVVVAGSIYLLAELFGKDKIRMAQ